MKKDRCGTITYDYKVRHDDTFAAQRHSAAGAALPRPATPLPAARPVEGAWTCRMRARVSRKRRDGNEKLPQPIPDIA